MAQSEDRIKCFECGEPLLFPPGMNVGRSEICPSCSNDVRVCLNCRHYDASAYNECREPQSERVLEKNRSNFCDYFSLGSANVESVGESKEEVFKKLDSLFK